MEIKKKFGIRRDLIHKLTEFSNSFEFTSLMANYNLTNTINQKPKAYFLYIHVFISIQCARNFISA